MRGWKLWSRQAFEEGKEGQPDPVSLGTRRAVATFLLIMGFGALLLVILRRFL